jgi:hypothetical protein
MPIYSFKCSACNIIIENYLNVNEIDKTPLYCSCGTLMERIFPREQNIRTFEPHWNPHIDPERPIWITSKRQLYEEAKKRGCKARYCEDSYDRKR